ncbi:MAG: hypothetical protein KDH96_07275 [Candidatus Riesia sp.]|nr:hypothetical protein [Candidatus Riesia sp.]
MTNDRSMGIGLTDMSPSKPVESGWSKHAEVVKICHWVDNLGWTLAYYEKAQGGYRFLKSFPVSSFPDAGPLPVLDTEGPFVRAAKKNLSADSTTKLCKEKKRGY